MNKTQDETLFERNTDRVSEPGKSTKYELHGLVEKLKAVKNTL